MQFYSNVTFFTDLHRSFSAKEDSDILTCFIVHVPSASIVCSSRKSSLTERSGCEQRSDVQAEVHPRIQCTEYMK